MTRVRWLCSISAATVLLLTSGLSSATAQQAQGVKMLLSVIGKSPLVRAEIESLLGGSAAEWLLGKSAAEIGEFAVNNDFLAANVAGRLSAADKLEWAGTVNALRLSENNQSLFMYRATTGVEGLLKDSLTPKTLNDPAAVTGIPNTERTLRITGLGDVKADPSYKVPLFDFGDTHVEYELKSIPAGKVLGAATGAAAVETCDQNCLDIVKSLFPNFDLKNLDSRGLQRNRNITD